MSAPADKLIFEIPILSIIDVNNSDIISTSDDGVITRDPNMGEWDPV